MARLMGGAVLAVKEYLETALPVAIAALNAETLDEIVIAEPAAYHIEEQVEAVDWPYVAILGDSTSVNQENPGSLGTRHSIAIAVYVMDDTGHGHLRTRVYRYAEAIASAMTAAGPSVRMVTWGDPAIDFAPAQRVRGTSQVVAGCIVNVVISRREAL